MLAVDTNILVYAHRLESPAHGAALETLTRLHEIDAWGIPSPCAAEFLSVVTHPKLYISPTPLSVALEALQTWLGRAVLLLETPAFWPAFVKILDETHVSGPLVFDARIAAICLAHGVDQLLTADRDFRRFPALRTRNPLSAD